MSFHQNSAQPLFFTRKGLINSPECLLKAKIVALIFTERLSEDGRVDCRFLVRWLQLANGEVIPTVGHPNLLPYLDEVLDSLENLDG